MAATGCLKPWFILFNCIFWLIGCFLVGYISWTLATNPALLTGFPQGTTYFTYTILAAGAFIFITGFLGCVGGLKEHKCLLITVIVLLSIFLAVEIGGAVAAYLLRDQLQVYRNSTWRDFNTDTRDLIQAELQCCGLYSYTEYNETVMRIPHSCFSSQTNTSDIYLNTVGCWGKIDEWLFANTVIWACTTAAVAVVQLMCLILAIVMLVKVVRSQKDLVLWDDFYDVNFLPCNSNAEKALQTADGNFTLSSSSNSLSSPFSTLSVAGSARADSAIRRQQEKHFYRRSWTYMNFDDPCTPGTSVT
ncbi:CD63 antigen-like [Haliotis rufescens]|uniref:CD63 antigen-like n=1 Tax=Haliotis rufescens TaxID=6454 RepID=UPI00201F9A45|nr:CD63 antigen-like [Haliotis rufescens]